MYFIRQNLKARANKDSRQLEYEQNLRVIMHFLRLERKSIYQDIGTFPTKPYVNK